MRPAHCDAYRAFPRCGQPCRAPPSSVPSRCGMPPFFPSGPSPIPRGHLPFRRGLHARPVDRVRAVRRLAQRLFRERRFVSQTAAAILADGDPARRERARPAPLRAPSFASALSGLAAIRSLDHTLWWSASKPGIGLSWWRSARDQPPGIDRAARHRATPSDACHLGGRCGPSRKADGRAGRAGILCVPVGRTGPEGRAR